MTVATGAIQVPGRIFFRLPQRLTFVERFVRLLRERMYEYCTILMNDVFLQVSLRLSVVVYELEFLTFQSVR